MATQQLFVLGPCVGDFAYMMGRPQGPCCIPEMFGEHHLLQPVHSLVIAYCDFGSQLGTSGLGGSFEKGEKLSAIFHLPMSGIQWLCVYFMQLCVAGSRGEE